MGCRWRKVAVRSVRRQWAGSIMSLLKGSAEQMTWMWSLAVLFLLRRTQTYKAAYHMSIDNGAVEKYAYTRCVSEMVCTRSELAE